MRIFTVPPEESFLDALVAGLRAQDGADPAVLARTTILLPTRRAVRALAEAFLRASDGRALLLPRLMPVGDLDAEELSLLGDEGQGDDALDIPPAIPDLRRRLMLTRLVLEWGRRQGTGPLTPGQAAPLAGELARFLDEVQTEGGSLDDLDRLVPGGIRRALAEGARIPRHRARPLARRARRDRRASIRPTGATRCSRRKRRVAGQSAGSSGDRRRHHRRRARGGRSSGDGRAAGTRHDRASRPRARLRSQDLEQILADPAHPQHVMARLLRRLELAPADVAEWPHHVGGGAAAGRSRVIFEALRPAASSERWRDAPQFAAWRYRGLRRLDCAGPQEEALAIAHLLRQALEDPGRTAALVTPDRDCARRVAAELRRWGIEIDDSAGIPLDRTPPGIFLRLVVAAAASNWRRCRCWRS